MNIDNLKIGRNLAISIITITVLFYFVYLITYEFIGLWYAYFNEYRRNNTPAQHEEHKSDDYKYERDRYEYININELTQRNIRELNRRNRKDIDKLREEIKKLNPNKNFKFDGRVDDKILNKDYDDYSYNHNMTIIDFFKYIFKPIYS
jgi:hypothetical protein